MKRLSVSFLFVLSMLLIVDRAGGKIMWWVNQHTNDLSGPKIRYLAHEANEDVVLLGTSRCNQHYVPSIISDSIGMSVYNGGIDASDCIYSHYYLLNLMLTHHKPKVICLDMMRDDYARKDNPFASTSFFAPYIGRAYRADSIFRHAGSYWPYRLCHLYRYNAKAVSNIGGLLVNRQRNNDNGYIPLPSPRHYPKMAHSHTTNNIDTLKCLYIQKFIDLCKDNDIKLVFAVSPQYSTTDKELYDTLKGIAHRNGIPFLDYHTTGMFLDHPEYYMDKLHLCDKGARIFSSAFAHDLKRILDNPCTRKWIEMNRN
ncbi:MAG: hypothetical protein NC113_10120 [Bacteroides sp.]|nr:hypothetical protein [Bacteroides sp.]MCM1448549.1 hypothetical protein [Bacteroides sp.]